MSRAWLALLDAPAAHATAQARLRDRAGRPAGWLAVWQRRSKPLAAALRIDGRMIDADGEATWISLVLPPAGVRLPFDDLAVQHARRAVLAAPPMDAVSTLLRDDSHFEGAITAGPLERLAEDPFARVFPTRILRVDAGVLGRPPAPCGPTIERYGSAQPWPYDLFNPPLDWRRAEPVRRDTRRRSP
jgi:hypothetical protein